LQDKSPARWPKKVCLVKPSSNRNANDDVHPLHLHRHSFELMHFGGMPTAEVIKDVMLGRFEEVEFDFVAADPGPTLFHCHQQLHMDFGFMAMINYA
jgi:FtsP/CotA-like multicopper oxidase with cupredoxin domain